MGKTKVCKGCNKELPMNKEYFYKAKENIDGLRGKCKLCMNNDGAKYREENPDKMKVMRKQWADENKDYNKKYYEENKEEIIKSIKKYYMKNITKIKKYNKKYVEDNKESIKEYKKQHYKENIEKAKLRSKLHRENNQEHYSAYMKQYRIDNIDDIKKRASKYSKENKETLKMYGQKRRAKKAELPNTLTIKQWDYIKQQFNNSCAYCGISEQEYSEQQGQQLHQEHFIALSKNGGYTHNNIIPSCVSCNSSKSNRSFFEWYPNYKCYNKQREKFILKYLGYTEDTQQLALFL